MAKADQNPDETARRRAFLDDVIAGLRSKPRTLPCKWLYDAHGSALFEQIAELEEYYPTRIELAITRDNAPAMAEALGPRCLLIEPGSGASVKTRVLLDHCDSPAGYVPVDISRELLLDAAAALRTEYADLPVHPIVADFTQPFDLPTVAGDVGRRVVYFPGSTIGNLDYDGAVAFLRVMAGVVGPDGGVLLGADCTRDPAVLERAYDDAEGVTAAFNANLLDRINRELGGDFNVGQFAHRATWNAEAGRIEMRLVSQSDQYARIGDHAFRFRAGDAIVTEHSHKYDLAQVADMAAAAGLSVAQVWTDADHRFGVHWLVTG